MKSLSIGQLAAAAALCFAVSGAFTAAQARNRERSVDRRINRDGGSVQRSTTWTNAQGKTGTHTYQRTVDPATKTATVKASTTLPDGRTAGRDLTTVKTDTGSHTTGTVTRFNGQTATVDATTTRTPNGWNRDTTLTGQNGQVAKVDTAFARTASGYTRDTTFTGPGGKTATTDVTVTRQDGTVTRTVTRTGPNGGSETNTQTHAVEPPPKS